MRKRLLAISCFFFCFVPDTDAQISGCTDPQATNYNASATVNDGSCTYASTNLALTEKTPLSTPLLDETSGLEFLDGKLWTFCDSNNPNDIYRVDTATNTVYQTVDISNATNMDWEDMTSSNDHLFVGDFGNNNGNRQDLKIYRINKADLTPTATSVTAAIVSFSYSDQTSFPSLPNNNNFDCESMIFLNDSIHLFSKDWVDLKTRHYVLPNSPGTHVAQYRETYNAGFLVTSASVQQSGVIALTGYITTGTRPISLVMLYDYKNNFFFNGNKRRFNLSTESVNGQVEGVDFFNGAYGYISNERFTTGANVAPKLKTFNLAPYLPAAFLSPIPDANFTANNTSVCANAFITFTDQSTYAPSSWQWSFTGGTPSTSTLANPQVQYLTAGTYSATLIAGNAAGYDTIVKTNYITVNALPSASITAGGATTFCSGGSVTLNANTGAGLTHQWKNNTVNISGATSASYAASTSGNYTCTVSNNCGGAASNAVDVTVNPTPVSPAVPTGPGSACRSTTGNLYSVSPVSGATSYAWSAPAGAILSSGQGSNSVSIDFGSTAVSGNICVYASNACGNSAPACKAITIVTAKPGTPASISGTTLPCASSSGIVYSCPVVNNAASYNWTVPGTATIAGGQGTNSITVNFGSTFTSGSIKVAAVNCVGSSSFRSITVRGKPSTPGVVTGQTLGVCAGTTGVPYSISPVTAATGYNWTAPPNATIASGQGTTAVTVNFNGSFTTGTLSVTASNACGASSPRNTTIRSVPVTPGTMTGTTSVCANQSGVAYSIAAVAGAITYNWVVPAGAVVASGQGTASVTVNFGTGGGSVKVNAGNACGNSTYRTKSVSVNCRGAFQASAMDFDATVFPNPSQKHFNLMFGSSDGEKAVLILRDLAGREIERKENVTAGENMEFGFHLPGGIYIAEVRMGEERKIFRVIKQE